MQSPSIAERRLTSLLICFFTAAYWLCGAASYGQDLIDMDQNFEGVQITALTAHAGISLTQGRNNGLGSGDLNNDGFADLVIGAGGRNEANVRIPGEVFIRLGPLAPCGLVDITNPDNLPALTIHALMSMKKGLALTSEELLYAYVTVARATGGSITTDTDSIKKVLRTLNPTYSHLIGTFGSTVLGALRQRLTDDTELRMRESEAFMRATETVSQGLMIYLSRHMSTRATEEQLEGLSTTLRAMAPMDLYHKKGVLDRNEYRDRVAGAAIMALVDARVLVVNMHGVRLSSEAATARSVDTPLPEPATPHSSLRHPHLEGVNHMRDAHGARCEGEAVYHALNKLQNTPLTVSTTALRVLAQGSGTEADREGWTTTLMASARAYGTTRFFFTWFADWRGRMYPLGSRFSPNSMKTLRGSMLFDRHPITHEADVKRAYENLMYALGSAVTTIKAGLTYASAIREAVRYLESTPTLESMCRHPEAASLVNMVVAAGFTPMGMDLAGLLPDEVPSVENVQVGMDATQSGLQILSVLAGAPATAEATNVTGTGAKRDLYGEVAHNVTQILQEELERWGELADPEREVPEEVKRKVPAIIRAARRAKLELDVTIDLHALAKLVSARSIVKRAVMVIPYNASMTTMGESVREAMQDADMALPVLGETDLHPDVEDRVWTLLLSSLGGVVSRGASPFTKPLKPLQKMLRVWARTAGMLNVPMEILMPDGVKVSYQSKKTVPHYVRVGSANVRMLRRTEDLNPIAMGRGASPNVIHAADAYVARSVIEACSHLPLITNQDCFTTTPAHAETVRDAYLEALASLTSWNIVEQFDDFMAHHHERIAIMRMEMNTTLAMLDESLLDPTLEPTTRAKNKRLATNTRSLLSSLENAAPRHFHALQALHPDLINGPFALSP